MSVAPPSYDDALATNSNGVVTEPAAPQQQAGPQDNAALLREAKAGNVKAVKQLIGMNADTNTVNNMGMTPLMLAAEQNHLEVAEVLLEANAVVDAGDKNGRTAMMIACEKGHSDMAVCMHEHHADIYAQNARGTTPLMFACNAGFSETAARMLERKADVHQRGEKDGRTALRMALGAGHGKVVKVLIYHNADVNICYERGMTSLILAAMSGSAEAVDALLEADVDINGTNDAGDPAVMQAIRTGNDAVAALLVRRGAKLTGISSSDPLHTSPAVFAVHHDSTQTLEAMLECKVVSARVSGGGDDDLFHLATQLEKEDIMRLLVKHNADVNATRTVGYTPLMAAANSGATEMVKLLVSLSADVHMCDNMGMNPIKLAIHSNHVDTCIALVEANADVNATSISDRTCLIVAASKGDAAATKRLTELGAVPARDPEQQQCCILL